MIEYTHAETHEGRTRIRFDRAPEPGQNIVRRGTEARAGQKLLAPGARLGYAELALAGQVGRAKLAVAARPRIAILSTGDEVVAVDATPGPLEIRNGNSVSLAAQVRLAGGEPVLLGNVADRAEELRHAIVRGLDADALVISGGVSAGKYDLVEGVLGELGTQFHFDAVAIRPGRPAVFGTCRGKPVFGLPGNPVSTMVTFELFLLPALDILSGTAPTAIAVAAREVGRGGEAEGGGDAFLAGEDRMDERRTGGAGAEVARVRRYCGVGGGELLSDGAAGEARVAGGRMGGGVAAARGVVTARAVSLSGRIEEGRGEADALPEGRAGGDGGRHAEGRDVSRGRGARIRAHCKGGVGEDSAPGNAQGQSAGNRADRRDCGGKAHFGVDTSLSSSGADAH